MGLSSTATVDLSPVFWWIAPVVEGAADSGMPAPIQRWNTSIRADAHGPSQGIEPARSRCRIAAALFVTSA